MFKSFKSRFQIDPYIAICSFLILLFGYAMFFSAALGVLARHEAKFYNIIQNQFFFGVLLGSLAFLIGAFVSNKFYKNISPVIYGLGIVLCVLVFIPGIGVEHGGAKRWIQIFGFSMQPSEVLKFASILFLSAFYSWHHEKFEDVKFRLLPVLLVALSVSLVLKEPDLGTSTVILSGIFGVFFLVNAKIKDMLLLGGLLIITFGAFYMYYPHAKERVNTFLFPEKNSFDQNFQANQTKISLGAGGIWGDGYGKSTQKFHNLPEPIGDSIFAVIGEEFGIVGTVGTIVLIFLLCGRLLYLSVYFRDPWPQGVLVGTGVAILTQTFLNAGSASGAIPFTGVPLPLISHGSTSIIIIMGMLGICAQLGNRKYMH